MWPSDDLYIQCNLADTLAVMLNIEFAFFFSKVVLVLLNYWEIYYIDPVCEISKLMID